MQANVTRVLTEKAIQYQQYIEGDAIGNCKAKEIQSQQKMSWDFD